MMRSRTDDLSVFMKLRLERKQQSKNGTAANVILNCHAATVRFHDFVDNGKTKTCSFSFGIPAPPKPVENALPILRHHSGSVIDHGDPTVGMHFHCHLSA